MPNRIISGIPGGIISIIMWSAFWITLIILTIILLVAFRMVWTAYVQTT
jgi:phage shock protein PspC (stress-responsive transcriptional regulator)